MTSDAVRNQGEMPIRPRARSLYNSGMRIPKKQNSLILTLALCVIVAVLISACANEDGQSGVKTHIYGDAGVSVSTGDVSRVSPSRPVPGRSY